MGMVFARPTRLISSFLKESSVWYAIVPFVLYIAACEAGWLSAFATGYQQAINPLPKLLPIADDQYYLYQAIFGPFVKGAGIFIFGGSVAVLGKALKAPSFALTPVVVFFTLVGYTLALVAIGVDQVIVWGPFDGVVRFALSTIHPLVFVVAVAYVMVYVQRHSGMEVWKTAVVVIPSMVLAGPVPGMLFR